MGMVAPVYYTADMVGALSHDGKRYETVHGELLGTPAPRAWHQEVLQRLNRRLVDFLAEYVVGHLFVSPADISWSHDTLVQPDLFVVDLEEARTMDWTQMQDLLLVVEVLSPSTARYDRFTKRRLYQEVHIPTYWIVDPDTRSVEIWTPQDELPQVERERAVWHPPGVDEPLAVELDELFRPL